MEIPKNASPDLVPLTEVVIDDAAGEVGRKTDEFFEAVLTHLGYELPDEDNQLDVQWRELRSAIPGSDKLRESDDRIALLIAENRVIASVVLWRTAFNYTQIVYAFYPPGLQPELP